MLESTDAGPAPGELGGESVAALPPLGGEAMKLYVPLSMDDLDQLMEMARSEGPRMRPQDVAARLLHSVLVELKKMAEEQEQVMLESTDASKSNTDSDVSYMQGTHQQ